jgi:hypothetical protein
LCIFSRSSIRVAVFHPINDCEHLLLYLPGTGIASQETAISGSFQQNLAGDDLLFYFDFIGVTAKRLP